MTKGRVGLRTQHSGLSTEGLQNVDDRPSSRYVDPDPQRDPVAPRPRRASLVADKEKPQGTLRIDLKYSPGGEPVIHGIERISRPGRRVYRNKQEIPRVLGGLGLAIVSTSKGVLAGHEAIKSGVGGEVLCQVW